MHQFPLFRLNRLVITFCAIDYALSYRPTLRECVWVCSATACITEQQCWSSQLALPNSPTHHQKSAISGNLRRAHVWCMSCSSILINRSQMEWSNVDKSRRECSKLGSWLWASIHGRIWNSEHDSKLLFRSAPISLSLCAVFRANYAIEGCWDPPFLCSAISAVWDDSRLQLICIQMHFAPQRIAANGELADCLDIRSFRVS